MNFGKGGKLVTLQYSAEEILCFESLSTECEKKPKTKSGYGGPCNYCGCDFNDDG